LLPSCAISLNGQELGVTFLLDQARPVYQDCILITQVGMLVVTFIIWSTLPVHILLTSITTSMDVSIL
jgi:hypothetical protein